MILYASHKLAGHYIVLELDRWWVTFRLFSNLHLINLHKLIKILTLVSTKINFIMAKPIIPNQRTWPRNLSTSQNGGLSTSQYGGMSTSQYGGLSTSQYGGLSTSQYGGLSTSQYGGLSTSQYGGLSTSQGGGMSTSSSNVYKSNTPPWPHFLRELETRGYDRESEMIRNYLPEFLWPEIFFGK
jgi:hypothetical protein